MLHAFGSNGSGQLGVGHTEDLSKPEFVLGTDNYSHENIKQLAAGGNHTVILYDDGSVFATGNNEDGRCGIDDLKQISRVTELTLPLIEVDGKPVQAKQVVASWSSTLVLSSDGGVYVCGTGNSGELGLGPDVTTSSSLRRIPALPPPGTEVVSLASGMAHTVAILSNGNVYGWGKGRKGQLGEPAHDVWSPRRIATIDFKAKQAACGKDFTLVVGEPATGTVIMLGPNGNDRFGIKSNSPVTLEGWRSISASWGSIYAVKSSGDVVAWGRNDHGQLPPTGLPEVKDIAAGSEHCLALTRAGKVLAWGWGEHGNCDLPTDDKGDVKGEWNEIDVPGRPSKIFAGCATSFIETEDD